MPSTGVVSIRNARTRDSVAVTISAYASVQPRRATEPRHRGHASTTSTPRQKAT